MSDLIGFVIGKHSGLQRWEQAEYVTAEVHVYGGFWGYKGQPNLLSHQSVTADLHRQRISMTPFGAGRTPERPGRRSLTITSDSQVIDELIAPRASMACCDPETRWTPTQTGYFISYATWTYLLEPFQHKRRVAHPVTLPRADSDRADVRFGASHFGRSANKEAPTPDCPM